MLTSEIMREYFHDDLPVYPSVTGLPQPITTHSLLALIGALALCCLLLISFTGWGRLTTKLFRLPPLPTSVACALGIASVLFLGGWINLVQGIRIEVLAAIVLIGLGSYALLRRETPEENRWRNFIARATPTARWIFLAAFLVCAIKLAATIRTCLFNVPDDASAYLAFPQKMLATHSFAFDPFSDRRIISSLGGGYFLQTFFIAATGLTHVGMADRTAGLLLLVVALYDLGVLFQLAAWQIALMELLAFSSPQEADNLTYVILPLPLLLASVWLLRKVWDSPERSAQLRYAILSGGISGATVCLKSTYVPIAGMLAITVYLFAYFRKSTARLLLLFAATTLSTFLVLAAWMLAMHHASGTYLFPVLGHGFDYSHYGTVPTLPRFPTSRTIIKVFLQAIALLILSLTATALAQPRSQLRFALSILAASIVAITAFNYKTGGDFIWRYNYPQFFLAILVFYCTCIAIVNRSPDAKRSRAMLLLGVLSLTGMLFYYDVAGSDPRPFRDLRSNTGDLHKGLQASLSGRELESPAIQMEYTRVQNSIPAGATALEDTGYSFSFDFSRNRIFIMDWPGASAPPPGWPYGASANRLATFLKNNSVQYVIFDYNYAENIDVIVCDTLELPRKTSAEGRELSKLDVLTHGQMHSLLHSYRTIYDDGKIAVIDLNQITDPVAASRPNWTFQDDEDTVCRTVLQRYVDGSRRSGRNLMPPT